MLNLNPSTGIPASLRAFFAKPPILLGESAAEYSELLAMVRAEVTPQRVCEWVLVKDITVAEWELLRLVGMKVHMLHAALARVAQAELKDSPRADSILPLVRRLVIDFVTGESEAAAELEKILIEEHLTLDLLKAVAFEHNVGPQLKTDQMIAAARTRRNAAYAELAKLRAADESLPRDLPDPCAATGAQPTNQYNGVAPDDGAPDGQRTGAARPATGAL